MKWLIMITLLVNYPLFCQPGCMANSHKLKQRYDSKEMHYVNCNCDCSKHAAKGLKTSDRNKCIMCGHYHDSRPLHITEGWHPDKIKRSTYKPQSAQTWITNIIANYHKSSH